MATSSNRIPNLANPFNILKLFTPTKHYHYFEQYSYYTFHDALEEVWETLKHAINHNDKPLWLTGHSLGGAISAIAAMRLAHRLKGFYSYGMPCVGGNRLATYCSQHLTNKTFHYVNENDFVAAVMPLFIPGYQHFGQEIPIKLKKHNSPFKFIGDIFKLDIIDHSPLFYMLGTRLAI